MAKQKISFKIPPKLWENFKAQTDSLFLSRAPFLDHMLSKELPELRRDLGERELSLRAKRYIAGELKRQGAKSVNIEVAVETARALDDAVEAHNLVRDAFICRLIIFLRGSDALLNHLDVPLTIGTRMAGGSVEQMPTSPLKAFEAVRDDPLFYARVGVRHTFGLGIYDVPLPPAWDWATCWIDDAHVPGTPAYKLEREEAAAMFEKEEKEILARPAQRRKEANK